MAMFNQWQQPQYNNYGFQPHQNLEWIMVPDVGQVEKVTVQPNQKAWIMCQNEPIFALRTADAMGLTTTDYYRFEKWVPNATAPASEYVTKSQMEKAIADAIGRLTNESVN